MNAKHLIICMSALGKSEIIISLKTLQLCNAMMKYCVLTPLEVRYRNTSRYKSKKYAPLTIDDHRFSP